MDATLGNNPSYIWRSLLWSRNLLRKGLCWRVGTGEKIATFRDKWISNLRSPIPPPSNMEAYSIRNAIKIGANSLCSSGHRWTKPAVNRVRLEVDAAYNENTGTYAIGGVVRDHEGNLIMAFERKIGKPPLVVYAELLAFHEGMKLMRDRQLVIHEFTTDSLLTMQAVTYPEENFSYIGAIATDVRKR
ncbi:uncharacterized protein [Henckelia pumila]|uniref:uncharacterized protein n=1 Tax=Henckelia pumila TaxID=405737 RepID=UPI003C6E892F